LRPPACDDVRVLRGIIRRALTTQRGSWGTVAIAALVALVPAAVLQGVLESAADGLSDRPAAFFLLAASAVGSSLLGYYFLSGVVAQIVVARRDGGAPPGLAEIARRLPYGRLLAVDLLASAAVVVGLELAVIPGIVLGTWFALAPALVETNHLRPRAALARSRELTRGHFGLVLALALLPLALVPAVTVVLELLGERLIDAPGAVRWGLASLVAGLLVKPFAAVVTVELAVELDREAPDGDARLPPSKR
jgi:hypothetical protein